MKLDTNPLTDILRIKAQGARKPLRTFKEMAEEFGVSEAKLRGCMSTMRGPKAILRSVSKTTQSNRWYDAVQMREWWRTVK